MELGHGEITGAKTPLAHELSLWPLRTSLIAHRHVLNLLAPSSPIVCLELCVLDPLLAPILMQSAHVVLALLKEVELIADAFLDKHSTGVLIDNGLLVLSARRAS